MRYSRVGRRSWCCVCQAVVVASSANTRAMAAVATPRCDRRRHGCCEIGTAGCCSVALPNSSNVSRHAQRTKPRRQIDALEQFRQHECWLRRDCGVESNTRASLISIYESGDSYVSTGCNTRVTTNDSKKGWNRSWRFRASVSIHILGQPRIAKRAGIVRICTRARLELLRKYRTRSATSNSAKKARKKASLTQKAQGC